MKTLVRCAAIAALCAAASQGVWAQKKYDVGASDTEIKIGQTNPYSGPASVYSSQGKVMAAYFKMLNEKGGINGRKVTWLSLDDGYSPPKTLEQVRKLVEQEEVLALMSCLGTPTNSAVQKYLNDKKIPHLLVSSGAARWNDPKQFPWSTPGYPAYVDEAAIYAKHAVQNYPTAKIGLLFQNDDSGRDYAAAFKKALGARAGQVVKELSFEVSDPNVDSQIIELKGAGVEVLFTNGIPKPMAQAIRKIAEIGWKPVQYLSATSNALSTLERAGYENSKGVITAQFMKSAGDPTWENDADMKAYLQFMKERAPELSPADSSAVQAYYMAHMAEHILRQAGDQLTRENVLKQATSLQDMRFPMLLPGVTVTVKPDDRTTFNTFRLSRFDGQRWMLFGEPIKVK